jgi:hypothetical protein
MRTGWRCAARPARGPAAALVMWALGCNGTVAIRPDGGTANCQQSPDGAVSAARVPVSHRPTGSTCPRARGPETPTAVAMRSDGGVCEADGGSCMAGSCAMDSDCTQGSNGRCGDLGSPIAYLTCSYDECFSDSECDAAVPCECRPSSSSNVANRCVTGGNCRVDSDCGSGGYCSPSLVDTDCSCPMSVGCDDAGGCWEGSTRVPCDCQSGDSCGHGYYCHTPCDTCVDDSDCGLTATCNYDVIRHLWGCSTASACPE